MLETSVVKYAWNVVRKFLQMRSLADVGTNPALYLLTSFKKAASEGNHRAALRAVASIETLMTASFADVGLGSGKETWFDGTHRITSLRSDHHDIRFENIASYRCLPG